MKRWRWVILFAVIALGGYVVWQSFQPPPGIEPKGSDKTIAELSYYTAIAGAVAGFLSLLKEIVALIREGRAK